eukprot:6477199-Amphidinium_carterae.1
MFRIGACPCLITPDGTRMVCRDCKRVKRQTERQGKAASRQKGGALLAPQLRLNPQPKESPLAPVTQLAGEVDGDFGIPNGSHPDGSFQEQPAAGPSGDFEPACFDARPKQLVRQQPP